MGTEIFRTTNSNPSNPNPEAVNPSERFTLVPLRELDVYNERDMTAYFELLTHPDNIEHFGNPPVNVLDLRRKLLRDRTHAYISENREGTIIGGGGINDAAEGERDDWLVKVVVHPDYKSKGVGRQLVVALIDKAFETQAITISPTRRRTERERIKLDAAVIRDVKGWEKMPNLLKSLGFRLAGVKENQVVIKEIETGLEALKPVETYEVSREDWFMRRQFRETVSNNNS